MAPESSTVCDLRSQVECWIMQVQAHLWIADTDMNQFFGPKHHLN